MIATVRRYITSDYPSLIALAAFLIGLLFSAFGLHGFLREHMGWLGPDLYAAAINLDVTKDFIVRGIVDDGTYLPYNHHAPTAFIFFQAVSWLGTGVFDKISLAYMASALGYALGWYVLYRVLLSFGFSRLAVAFGVIFTASSSYFLFYRCLLSFDCFSVLGSAGVLYALALFEKVGPRLTKSQFSLAIVICALAIWLSWYSLPIVGLYFLSLFMIRLYQKDNWQQPFWAGFLLVVAIVLLIAWILLTNYQKMGNFSDIHDFIQNDAAVGQVMPERFMEPWPLALALFGQFKRMLPSTLFLWSLAAIFVGNMLCHAWTQLRNRMSIIRCHEKPISNISLSQLPMYSVLCMLCGTILFIYFTRYWSWIHPFGFMYLAAPFSFTITLLISKMSAQLKGFIAILLIVSTINVAMLSRKERDEDVARTKLTSGLLSLVETEFPSNYAFSLPFSCGDFNPGMMYYIASSPNYIKSAIASPTPPERQVLLTCLDEKQSLTSFATADGKRNYTISANKPFYETAPAQ